MAVHFNAQPSTIGTVADHATACPRARGQGDRAAPLQGGWAQVRPLLALPLLALAACAAPGPSDAPILPPTGTMGSAEVLRLFAEACLPHFPDADAAGRAFAAQGFARRDTRTWGGWTLDGPGGLRAVTGTSIIEYEPPGPGDDPGPRPSGQNLCRIEGDLSDPEAFAAALRRLPGPGGRPLAWTEGAYGALSAPLDLPAAPGARIEAQPPSLALVSIAPEQVCGGPEPCQVWRDVQLAIVRDLFDGAPAPQEPRP